MSDVNNDDATVSTDTEEKVTMSAVNAAINKAFNARLKAFEAKNDSKFEELKTLLSSNTSKKEVEEEKEKAPSRTKILEEQVAAMKAERDAERAELKAQKLNSTVSSELTKRGISPKLVKAAMALLKEDKMVTYDDVGKLVFKDGEDYDDFETGISKWVKTEGQAFVEAKELRGSGAQGIKNTRKQITEEVSDTDIETALQSLL